MKVPTNITPDKVLSFPFGDPEIRSNAMKAITVSAGTIAAESAGASTIASTAAAVISTVAIDIVAPIAVGAAIGYGIYKLFSD